MSVWIALLRGINVGGHHKLPMRDFSAILESLGHEEVATYIQSGNAVFRNSARDAGAVAASIREAIDDKFEFAPDVLVVSRQELHDAVKKNPYAGAVDDHKALHVSFLAEKPTSPDLETMSKLAAESESFTLDGRCFYLHAPDGMARSRLAAKVEKLLGVAATSRNWRTVNRLLTMARDKSD